MSKNHPFSHWVVSPRCNQRGEVRKDGIADCVTQFPNQPHSENSESILGEFCLHSPSQFCNLSCCVLHKNQRKPFHINGFLHCRIPIDRWIWVVFAQCWPCRRVVGLGLKACSWCYWGFKFYNIIITIVIIIIVIIIIIIIIFMDWKPAAGVIEFSSFTTSCSTCSDWAGCFKQIFHVLAQVQKKLIGCLKLLVL